jgi:hypothetical protein
MSKNVGLMRKANAQVALQEGNGQARIGRIDLDQASPHKRIEQLEISDREARSRGALLHLAGIDARESCSGMFARVAGILVRPVRKSLLGGRVSSFVLVVLGFGLGNPQGFGQNEEVAR